MNCGNWIASDTIESFTSGHKLVKQKEPTKSEYSINIDDKGKLVIRNAAGAKLITRENI